MIKTYTYTLKVKYREGYFIDPNKPLEQELEFSSIYKRTVADIQKCYNHCKVISAVLKEEKPLFELGQTINHPKFGEGVIVDFPNGGYHVTVEFKCKVKEVSVNNNRYDFDPTNLKLILQRNANKS